jgi:hypothetical protein
MSYEEIISRIGITQSNLELVIIFTCIVVVVGYILFHAWRYILAGVFALGIIVVFSHHPSEAKEKDRVVDEEKAVFMANCYSLTEKASICEELWRERKE